MFWVTILLSFWEPCSYIRLSSRALSLRVALPAFSTRFRLRRLWLCWTIPLVVRCLQCRFLRLGSCIQSSCLSFSCVFLRLLQRRTFFNFDSLLPCLVCSFGCCCAVITRGLCVYVLSVFSRNLSLHAALLTFFLHSVLFAVALVLRTISFAVRLPGWEFLCLWYLFPHAVFVFFCLLACGVAAAFACISTLLFPCLVCNL